MPAAIVSAVVAAGATAYNAYAQANAGGVPTTSTAKQLNQEQQQLAKLQTQLTQAQAKGDSTKVAQLQTQIANLKLVLGAQTNTLSSQAGNLPAVQTPTPVVNVSGVKNSTLALVGGLFLAALAYLFLRKK